MASLDLPGRSGMEWPDEELKKCGGECGQYLPRSEFSRDSSKRDGKTSFCKDCGRRKNRKWHQANPDRKWARHLAYRYKMTPRDYEVLLEKQGGGCALCGRRDPGRSRIRRFPVDHDHITGRNRGLLCHECNIFAGYLQRNFSLLMPILRYFGIKLSRGDIRCLRRIAAAFAPLFAFSEPDPVGVDMCGVKEADLELVCQRFPA